MAQRYNLYLGQAGQAAVMAEFLVRGWNVAVPQVDVGDDLFIIRDNNGQFLRVQVKTASGQERSYGYSGQFRLPLPKLWEAALASVAW
ncbi:group I intron-associated PD-(D/E)XK endonuclease, partial [Prochlorothrix hollandica]|uniref:group I intron-associated PD-(D/E)XK endonuclease n=1 Tax=Prochlorothrix hollandica TaxID=1223 RepID=UPI003342D24C